MVHSQKEEKCLSIVNPFDIMDAHKPTVLVVEDEVLLLEAISQKLSLNNIEVVGATSCEQAIDYLKNLSKKPDAIWLDYYLGDLNGLDFMQEVRKHKEWNNIPVLVVSNSASPDKVKKMLELGVKKYMIKAEHRLDELVEEIQSFIKEINEQP